MTYAKHAAAIGLTLLTAVGTAAAADGAGWYAGISAGRAGLGPDAPTIDSRVGSALGVSGINSSLESHDTGYEGHFGYDYGNGIAAEVGYVNFGKIKYSGNFTGPAAGTLDGEVKARGVTLDVLGKVPLAPNLSLFGKAGAIYADVKTTATASGVGSIDATAKRWAPNLGFGMEYAVTRSLGLRAAYDKYYKLGDDATGKGDANLLSLGVNLHF